MNKRIYIAVPVGNALAKEAPKRLVNSGTPAAARLHITKNLYEIRPATTHEVATLVSGGTKVEEAGADDTAAMPGTES